MRVKKLHNLLLLEISLPENSNMFSSILIYFLRSPLYKTLETRVKYFEPIKTILLGCVSFYFFFLCLQLIYARSLLVSWKMYKSSSKRERPLRLTFLIRVSINRVTFLVLFNKTKHLFPVYMLRKTVRQVSPSLLGISMCPCYLKLRRSFQSPDRPNIANY